MVKNHEGRFEYYLCGARICTYWHFCSPEKEEECFVIEWVFLKIVKSCECRYAQDINCMSATKRQMCNFYL